MFSIETTIAGRVLVHKETGSKCLCVSQDNEGAVIFPSLDMIEKDSLWISGTVLAVQVKYEEINRQFEPLSIIK